MIRKTITPVRIVFFCFFLLLPLSLKAADSSEAGDHHEEQSLDQAANDPTASLMNVQLQNLYSGEYHNLDDESGLSDLVLFDLLAFDESWGRWGVGVVGLFPTASDEKLGSGKWGAGPAVGFVARSSKFMWGVFNQNIFSYAGPSDREDVGVSIIQPIVNISLPNKWSIGVSEMNITYDWEKSDWTSLPLGLKLNKMVRFGGKMPVMFSGSYEYNIQR